MNKEEKIEYIKENSEIILIALNSYLDSLYTIVEKYFDRKVDEDNSIKWELKEGLENDPKLEKAILDAKETSIEYEKVRNKIINKDFNLSLVEIAQAGIACNFLKVILDKQYTYVYNSQQLIKEIISNLTSGEELNNIKIK